MLDTAILTALADLTRRLRERTGDDRACAIMQIDPATKADYDMPPIQLWLHGQGLTEKTSNCTHLDAASAQRALWLADDYLAIDSVHRALQWLDEVAWVESSWTEPGGIPRGVIHRAEIKQEAAQRWVEDHPAAVAAERAARREAQYRAQAAGDQQWAAALPRRAEDIAERIAE